MGVDASFVNGLTSSQKAQLNLEEGHLFEQGAIAILGKRVPILASPAQFANGLEFTEAFHHRSGITLACEPGGFLSKAVQEISLQSGRDAAGRLHGRSPRRLAHGLLGERENNGSLCLHSDMPMAPAKPLQLVWAAINRIAAEGDIAGPEHKVPLAVALEAITIDAAHSIQQEKRLGSIEVGKDANLTILSESPYDVAPMAVDKIAVWGIMLEGRLEPVAAIPNPTTAARPAAAARSRRDTALLRDVALKLGEWLSHDGHTEDVPPSRAASIT